MKNITVLKLDEAFDHISACKEKYSVLHIVKNKESLKRLYSENGKFGRLDLYTEHRKVKDLLKADKNCIEVTAEQFMEDDHFIQFWQADEIIRFCQRQFDIDNVFIIHEDHYNAATNLADQLALCYDIDFEYDYSVEQFDYLRRQILIKHSLITYSTLYTLSPLDYCKMICRYTFKKIINIIKGKTEIIDISFYSPQGVVYYKNGIKTCLDLGIGSQQGVIQDIDEIEYVEFEGVPEITEPSAFSDYYGPFLEDRNIHDFYDDRRSLKSQNGTRFVFDSINGLQRVKSVSDNTPEKYKNYRTIERTDCKY